METSLTQYQARLILNGLPHVGPVMFRRLMDAFDNNGTALTLALPTSGARRFYNLDR